MYTRVPALALLVAIAGTACVETNTGPEPEPGGAEVAAVTAVEQPAAGVAGEGVVLSVRVTDASSTPIADVPVNWSASDGASIAPEQTLTDASGKATATLTLGQAVGSYTATATVGELEPVIFDIGANPAAASSIVLSSDSLRFMEPGETVTLTATAADEFGNPIPASEISWSSADPSIATVDQDGVVESISRGTTTIRAAAAAVSATANAYVIPLGYFTITFDDGFETTYTAAYPILEAEGLRANLAINPTPIDRNWDTYLSLAQVEELHSAGWSIINHTMGHPHLPELSAAEMEAQILDAQAWIDAHGYTGGNVFIPPYHDWGDREKAVVRSSHDAARGYSSNPPYFDEFQSWPAEDPYHITGIEPEVWREGYGSAEVREEIIATLDRVIDHGQIVDIFFHVVPSEDEAALRALAEMLGERKDRFRTYGELTSS